MIGTDAPPYSIHTLHPFFCRHEAKSRERRAEPPPRALVPPQAPSTTKTVLHSWQPNTNFNGEQENRLTDFERAARDAGAGERKVTIRKPLGRLAGGKRVRFVSARESTRRAPQKR